MKRKNLKKKQNTYKKAQKNMKHGGTKKVRTVFSSSFLNDNTMLDNTFVFDDRQEQGKEEGFFCTFRKYLNDIYYDVEHYLAAIKADEKESKAHGKIKLQGYSMFK